MIQVDALTKTFDHFTAVDRITFNVGRGEVLALLGPNGAGKTTTIRMLTAILTPTSGNAMVAGFNVCEQPEKVRSQVGVLTEHHGLYVRMNAVEYLGFYGDLYALPTDVRERRVNELLEKFSLVHEAKKRLGEYSKGMRQKLALARALLHDPPVLLLDEPTSAMDPESAYMVRESIRTLKSNERTVIICTHNLNEAEQLADQILIIRKGKKILSGTPQDIKQHLLGNPLYEVKINGSIDDNLLETNFGTPISSFGQDWLQFEIDDPLRQNPEIFRSLMAANIGVISFKEVPRSLDDAYLKAVNLGDNDRVG